jgi:hypothetical protein
MTEASSFAFTVKVRRGGWGFVVTALGHLRRRRQPRVDLEHVLIAIGALGVIAAVAVALWG